ncbi:uncharacterized protein LOC129755375 [Uranotaenia lowii]|uniref:uncharacterized protein LOC129755375 n=1 Tax=Uranotaenia lowii TaxID=190385 RepID=UPI00247A3091|nr:uncharacterized protein LOC129755375 [Uranotaenia lowii]XP_055607796.1 uncharacterized protein LOC129755375 [Uranotaenia lowii]XP_055607797.1 uncharacterized protein LOC129755375 [Uranotaenia lowii]XP_055607798.1 uncharacterized protein LOC129755375 [Uranotaenia lowii]
MVRFTRSWLILGILAALQWITSATAYHLSQTASPGIQTLGNLMAVPSLAAHQLPQMGQRSRSPHQILFPPPRTSPNASSTILLSQTQQPPTTSIDRAYHKARKIIYKYPRKYGPPKRRPPHHPGYPSLHPKFYSYYSHWSPCDVHCQQRRERHCVVRSKCGHHVHVEERPCPHKYCFHDHDHSPLHKYSLVESYKPKKKKRIIVEDDDEDEDYYEDDDDTEYVIIKKKHKRKRKRPQISIYHRREETVPEVKPVYDYDELSEQRIQNSRNKQQLLVEDFDDQRIFSPSPHYVRPQGAAQNFYRRPHPSALGRKPSRLTDFFEDDYDHLYRDGTGFANRQDEFIDFNGFIPISEPIVGKIGGNISTTAVPEVSRLLDSFPTEVLPTTSSLHHAKREVSNFIEESEEDFETDLSDEEASNSTAVELSSDGKKYPGKGMTKQGYGAQKKAREKAVFEMPRKVDNPYSKWSRWSKCTAKCTTRRFKRCKVPAICGNDVIREIAYCYTEGSFCEEWIGNQLYQNNKGSTMLSTTPSTTTTTTTTTPKSTKPARTNQLIPPGGQTARSRSDQPLQDNSIAQQMFNSRKGFLQPEYMPQELTCGLPMVRNKSKKYLYNMLRIIGGKTSRRGQWPWQVAILNRFKEAFCGGTLVAPRWILTAAHCVRKRLFVRLGEHHLQQTDGTEIEFRIEFSIKHPRYDKKTVDNDVALLRLPREVERSSFVGYACLPERYQPLPIGHTCTIIGWGKKRHSDDAGTDVLHEAEVPIITNERCRAVYHDYTITKNMFCAGHKRGRVDTCAGDSGGPLLCRDTTKVNSPWTIFGITSFGDGCGKKNKFGIYTKLPNYVDWIWSVINCDGNCRS